MRSFVLLVGIALVSSSTAQTLNAGALATPGPPHHIAFRDARHELLDSVWIAGAQHRFLLDTGAPLCISRELQQHAHYPVVHTADLHDANGHADTTQVVLVDTLRVGGFTFCGIPAVVLDIAHSPLRGLGVDGLLGGNVLRFLVVRFDAAQHEVLLAATPAEAGMDTTHAHAAIPADGPDFLLPLTLGDCSTDTVSVDSGMGDALVLNGAACERLEQACNTAQLERGKARKSHTSGMLGRDKDRRARYVVHRIGLGGTTLTGEQAFTATGGSSRLGRALIAQGVLVLDYPRGRFTFTR